MKKLIGLGLTVIFCGLFSSYEWPIDDPVQVTTFGQKKGAVMVPGMEMTTKTSEVKVPHPGRVVFSLDSQRQRHQALPSALGSLVAMDHMDAEGKYSLRTVVAGLPGLPSISTSTVERGQILGSLNLQPDSPPGLVKIFVFDLKDHTVVNPLLFFPAVRDQKAPAIKEFKAELEQGQKGRLAVVDRIALPADYWRLVVESADSVDDQPPGLGIYGARVFQGGSEIFNMELSAFESKDGKLYIPGQSEAYSFLHPQEKIWRIGRPFINAGTNTIEVEIRDKTGNTATRTFTIVGTR